MPIKPIATIFFLASFLVLLASSGTALADQEKVTLTGTLETGMMAIGGETTGTVLHSGEKTWELEISSELADELNGKQVRVTGTFKKVARVTGTGHRKILVVESIEKL